MIGSLGVLEHILCVPLTYIIIPNWISPGVVSVPYLLSYLQWKHQSKVYMKKGHLDMLSINIIRIVIPITIKVTRNITLPIKMLFKAFFIFVAVLPSSTFRTYSKLLTGSLCERHGFIYIWILSCFIFFTHLTGKWLLVMFSNNITHLFPISLLKILERICLLCAHKKYQATF